MRSSSGQTAYLQFRSNLSLSSIRALDGVRAIAVLFVIFYHLRSARAIPAFPGPLGVLSFFVLSGFLITWLLLKEEDKSGSVSLRSFYRRRALRIFPAFYVFWIVAVALHIAAHGEQVPWAQALGAFFYVSNYVHALLQPAPFMIQTWSLSAEEQFYLLWPLTFVMFSKRRRSLMTGLALVIVAVWVHRIHLWMAAPGKDYIANYIAYAFDTRADALLVGCLLALGLREGLATSFLERMCRAAWGPALTCLLIGCSVFVGQSSVGYRLIGGLAVEPLAILICQFVAHSASLPWKWLNAKPVRYLGRISYPLYLYHRMAIHAVERFPHLNTPLFLAMTLCLSIVIASCSYHFVEKPFLALKTSSSPARQTAKVPPRVPAIGDDAARRA